MKPRRNGKASRLLSRQAVSWRYKLKNNNLDISGKSTGDLKSDDGEPGKSPSDNELRSNSPNDETQAEFGEPVRVFDN
jgi:hypothetical protein